MALKKGDTCYQIMWEGKQIEYWEYVLRTIQTRDSVVWGYWWPKLPGVTWGKVSSKHRDFGWLKDAWSTFRVKKALSKGRPYAASKAGALRDAIAELRRNIKEYGADCCFDDDSGPTLDEQLKVVISAQKRLRKSQST